MPDRQYSFAIAISHPGRQQEEEWQTIEPQESAFWRSAARKLSQRRYEHKGCTINVAIDWTPLGRRLIRDHNLMAPVRTGLGSSVDWFSKLDRPLRMTAECEISGKNDLAEYPWYPEFFVEYFLYEVFTIANLSCPGSAEFHNIEIQAKGRKGSTSSRLSAYYFAEWMIETRRGATPSAKVLSVDNTIEWFGKVNPRVTQKAENSTQRALFAMYQLCKSDGQVDYILWLFNALESLLATRVGENFSGVVRRAVLLLELNDKEKTHLTKKLRELYDIRSSFVHGGYEVAHPLHREPIDPRLDDDYSKLIRLGTYGFGVLASLFQAMVERQLSELKFEERLVFPKNAP